MMTDVELLRHSPLLAGLTPDEAVALVEIAEVRTYADGDTLVEEGAESDGLFILKSGSLIVEKRRENGEGSVTLTTFGDPGDFFGEMSLIDIMPRSADIRASGPAEALAFPKHDQLFHSIASRPDDDDPQYRPKSLAPTTAGGRPHRRTVGVLNAPTRYCE
jgi:signal-transduction protein with cAMP-binding, CBS, and nucleotidyltransferase domain